MPRRLKMFSIKLLNEMLGYEKWVLKESVLAMEKYRGLESDSTITFQEDGLKIHQLQLHDELGANKRVEVLEKLSPLLFVTSYKIIDMLFEWILIYNCKQVPWKFKEKRELYKKLDKQSNLSYPPLLCKEKEITDTLFELYRNLSIYRNKVIHGNWGRIDNGDLLFSFEYKKKKYKKKYSFKDVMNFAEVTSLIAELLTDKPEDSAEVIITIKYLLDSIKIMHQGSLFNISKPRHYRVKYEVFERKIVDIKNITQYLSDQTFNHPFTFKLLVTSQTKRWEFPWEVVKNFDSINLEDNYDNFLT